MSTVTNSPQVPNDVSIADTTDHALDAMLARAESTAAVLRGATRSARHDALHAIADTLESDRDALVCLADSETHLGGPRLDGEMSRTIAQLRCYADVIMDGAYLHACVSHRRSEPGTNSSPDLRRTMLPVGPVLVFAASNFPFAFSVAGTDTASALAAGCPVIVKANPNHPRLSRRVADLINGALAATWVPPGAFDLIFGIVAGTQALADRRIRAAAFTGSLAGGLALHRIAANRPDPIPFYGELGSLNPVVISPAAAARRPEDIVDGLVSSFTLGTGQFCTKPGLVLMPESPSMLASLRDRVAGCPATPMLSVDMRNRYLAALGGVADHPAITTLTGTDAGPSADGGTDELAMTRPTVLVSRAAELLAERDLGLDECFGPSTLVVTWADWSELTELVRRLPGALTATIHCEADEADTPQLRELAAELASRVGRLVFNGWPTGVAVDWAQHHGGPFPATTHSRFTSVGAGSIDRFVRPVVYQDAPTALLPIELRDEAALVARRVDGVFEVQ